MRITFCGTAAGIPTAERACSGIVVQQDGRTVMLDCGPGSIREALKAGIGPGMIEAILLSHLHFDHTVDLSSVLHFGRGGRLTLPRIFGPPGTAAVLAAATAFFATIPSPRPRNFAEAEEISDNRDCEIAGFAVASVETPHAPEVRAFARKLSAAGASIVYSGDTQPNPKAIVPLAEGANLLIHEAYSKEMTERAPLDIRERIVTDFARGHTEVREAASIARDAGVQRLILTHIVQREDPHELKEIAASVFKGEIIVAYDGLVLDV